MGALDKIPVPLWKDELFNRLDLNVLPRVPPQTANIFMGIDGSGKQNLEYSLAELNLKGKKNRM